VAPASGMTLATPIKKRLCIVTHVCRKNDGQGRVNYEIAKAALAAGWRVTIVAAEVAPELATQTELTPVIIRASRLPSRLLKYQIFAWQTARWLRRHADQFDIIHVNGFITWAASDVNTAHFVHSGWLASQYYPYRAPRSLGALYQRLFTGVNAWLEKAAFRKTRAAVAVSSKIAAELAAIGIASSRVTVIANGVDLAEFRPGAAERAAFGLPTGVPLALFAGDIRTPRKNLDSVLRALAIAQNCHLAVAGALKDSPYPAMANALGLSQRVHFLGMIKDMPALMRCADLFVFPSRYEAFSLVGLEALASGLPILTAKSAGGSEIVEDGGRVLENSDDVATLAAWIAELATQPAQREAMGRRARQIAERYSWQIMGAKYIDLYQRLS
jgi:glycosyltransferase involved in cell wall biosynthesis